MARAPRSFLGTGWGFPPTFVRATCTVAMVSDETDIRESLWILLSTSVGERILLPQYGTPLWQTVFRAITTTLSTEIRDMLAQAILMWEPRVTVDDIAVAPDDSVHGLLRIALSYTIRKTNVRANLVYPFYTQEMTIPSPPI